MKSIGWYWHIPAFNDLMVEILTGVAISSYRTEVSFYISYANSCLEITNLLVIQSWFQVFLFCCVYCHTWLLLFISYFLAAIPMIPKHFYLSQCVPVFVKFDHILIFRLRKALSASKFFWITPAFTPWTEKTDLPFFISFPVKANKSNLIPEDSRLVHQPKQHHQASTSKYSYRLTGMKNPQFPITVNCQHHFLPSVLQVLCHFFINFCKDTFFDIHCHLKNRNGRTLRKDSLFVQA